jgi:hypothetical protein
MNSEIPQTTLDALILFTQAGETQIPGRFIANLKTALRNVKQLDIRCSDIQKIVS